MNYWLPGSSGSDPLDHPREECGVVGIYTPGTNSASLTAIGLFALQHRGQESAGVAASDAGEIRAHTGMGLVSEAFADGDLDRITGDLAIGHTRYSTTGTSAFCNAQPLLVDGVNGPLAVAHNGNIINAVQLREQLQARWDCAFDTTTDSEVVAHQLANAPGSNLGRTTIPRNANHAGRILIGDSHAR